MKVLPQVSPQEILLFLKKIDAKSWVRIALIGTVALLFLFAVVFPAWFERLDVKNKIKNIRNDILLTSTLILQKPELERNKQESIEFIREAKERIYLPGESSLLLGAISKLGEESRIAVIASKPKTYEGKLPDPFNAQYEANQYDFAVEGGYHDLAAFISRIESNPKLLRVQAFYLRPQEEAEGHSHLADISLSAVSFKKESK